MERSQLQSIGPSRVQLSITAIIVAIAMVTAHATPDIGQVVSLQSRFPLYNLLLLIHVLNLFAAFALRTRLSLISAGLSAVVLMLVPIPLGVTPMGHVGDSLIHLGFAKDLYTVVPSIPYPAYHLLTVVIVNFTDLSLATVGTIISTVTVLTAVTGVWLAATYINGQPHLPAIVILSFPIAMTLPTSGFSYMLPFSSSLYFLPVIFAVTLRLLSSLSRRWASLMLLLSIFVTFSHPLIALSMLGIGLVVGLVRDNRTLRVVSVAAGIILTSWILYISLYVIEITATRADIFITNTDRFFSATHRLASIGLTRTGAQLVTDSSVEFLIRYFGFSYGPPVLVGIVGGLIGSRCFFRNSLTDGEWFLFSWIAGTGVFAAVNAVVSIVNVGPARLFALPTMGAIVFLGKIDVQRSELRVAAAVLILVIAPIGAVNIHNGPMTLEPTNDVPMMELDGMAWLLVHGENNGSIKEFRTSQYRLGAYLKGTRWVDRSPFVNRRQTRSPPLTRQLVAYGNYEAELSLPPTTYIIISAHDWVFVSEWYPGLPQRDGLQRLGHDPQVGQVYSNGGFSVYHQSR